MGPFMVLQADIASPAAAISATAPHLENPVI
jgi:hypothetical protein